MPEAAPRGRSRSAARGNGGRSDATLPALRVRYYRRMKPNKVYSFEVSWEQSDRPPRGDGKEVALRLVAAGAQVVPTQVVLDATEPDEKAVFYVTPLARGWLQNVKLEVLAGSRKVQEIALASKVVSQRRTWFWFLLSFLLPYLILTQLKYGTPEARTVEVDVNEPGIGHRGSLQIIQRRSVKERAEQFIAENIPEVPEIVNENVPQVEPALKDARTAIADAFDGLVDVARTEPLAFYVWGVLLLLTLASAFFSREKRKRAYGKPITLGGPRRDDDDD